MKGRILDFSVQSGQGVIAGDDGKRYQFQGSDWKANSTPTAGTYVDFEAQDHLATGIYVVATASSNALTKRIVAALLALFVGGLGIHKFYLGMNKPGIIMLCIWLFGWILLGIPTAIISLIGFVEFIIYITKSDDEFEQTYVLNKREWF